MHKFDARTNVRRWVLGAGVLATSATLAVSAGSSNGATAAKRATAASTQISGKPLKGKTIAFISAAPIEYYNYEQQAATMAVESLGGTVKVYQSNGSEETEQASVKTAITQGVSGVLEIPLSTAGERTELAELKRAKIPVVMYYGWDPSLKGQAAGFIGADFYNYGYLVGKQMAKVVPSGKLAIVEGLPGRGEVPDGVAGLEAGLGSKSRVVAVVPANWDEQTAFNQTKSLITKYPNLKGIMVENDGMAIGVVQALGSKIKQVAVSSMNGSPQGLALLKAGKIKAEAGNSIPIEAAQGVRYLVNALAGKTTSPNLCYTPISIDTPSLTTSKSWIPTPTLIKQGFSTPCVNTEN